MVQNQKLRRTASDGVHVAVAPRVGHARRRVLHHVVEAVEEHRHPADPALGERHVQLGEAQRDARPQPVGRREHARAPGRAWCSARAATPATSAARSSPTRCGCRRRCRSPRTARRNGSQWSVCTDGSARLFMLSGNVTALNPRSALRRTSSAATSGSRSHASCSGMMRSGYVPAHTSWCQSFHARTHARPSSWSWLRAKATPAKPGDERREAEAAPRCRRRPCRRCGRGCPSSPCASRRSAPAPSSTRPSDGRRPR